MELPVRKKKFNPGDYINILRRKIWFLILPVVIIPGGMLAGSFFLKPVYDSYIIISLGKTINLSTDLQNLVGGDLSVFNSGLERREIQRGLRREIMSTPNLIQLIQVMKLDQNPALDGEAAKLASYSPHMSLAQIKSELLQDDLRERILVRFVGLDHIKIIAESYDPYQSRDLAQNMAEIFMTEKMRNRIGFTRKSEDFSFDQLEKYELELNQKLDQKVEFEKEYNNIVLDSVIESAENRNLIELEMELIKADIIDKERRLGNFEKELKKLVSADFDSEKLTELSEFKEKATNAWRPIGTMIFEYAWNSPEIIKLKGQISPAVIDLENALGNSIDIYYKDLKVSEKGLVKDYYLTQAALDQDSISLKFISSAHTALINRIGIIPEYQARYEQIEREMMAARDLRDQFQEYRDKALVTQAILRDSEFKIIQPAEAALKPVRPDKLMLTILGLILGFIIGIGTILISELFDTTFRKAKEVENLLGLPVIGIVPSIENIKKLRQI
jgi:uncharacterized protein involved in exopolysaccharide biosynthesis